jgi:hypothetical protein
MNFIEAKEDSNHLFSLRIPVRDAHVVIHAFEARGGPSSHTRLDVEVSAESGPFHGIVFERGMLYCGIPGHDTIDGAAARECVLALVAMKPGDADSEYFEGYTEDQRDFARNYGDDLSMARETYCDENGRMREGFDLETDPLEIRDEERPTPSDEDWANRHG